MSDTPFVGPSYNLTSRPSSVQRTVNMMPVPLEPGNERTAWVFEDVPGLMPLNQATPAVYYTSWPYALYADERLNADLSIPLSGRLWIPPLEQLNADLSIPLSGTLVTVLHTYSQPPEALNADISIPLSGTLVTVLHTYSQPAEALNADLSIPLSGTLVKVLVTYSAPPETLNADLSIPLSGTLT